MRQGRKCVGTVAREFLSEQSEDPEGPDLNFVLTSSPRPGEKNVFKGIDDLKGTIAFNPLEFPLLKEVEKLYHVRVPDYYLSLIRNPDDQRDPVRLQCVPDIGELKDCDEANIDPLAEESMSPVSCLVHRYPDRALLLVTGECFMYCRHCTRKRLWKEGNTDPTLDEIGQAADYIRANPRIREIIVSGGDPLFLGTERLDYILHMISAISSVEVIRIGTRAPVVFPKRIDQRLCDVLARYPNLWINLQFNHPNEITPESMEACRKLQACGIPLSNQSVLLKGVNDDPEIMKELCQKLQANRIRPYYIFQCDPVVGASHFRTNIYRGIEIIEKMRGHTSGMCIPTFVVDGPDGRGKIPIGPNYIVSQAPGNLTLRNYRFEVFEYINPDSGKE